MGIMKLSAHVNLAGLITMLVVIAVIIWLSSCSSPNESDIHVCPPKYECLFDSTTKTWVEIPIDVPPERPPLPCGWSIVDTDTGKAYYYDIHADTCK